VHFADHIVREVPDYVFEIEEWRRGDEQYLFAHFTVRHWARSVAVQMLREWRLFRSVVTAPLFAFPKVEDDKWTRFVTLLGFRPFTTIVCTNGEVRSMYLHQVDNALVETRHTITDGHPAVVAANPVSSAGVRGRI